MYFANHLLLALVAAVVLAKGTMALSQEPPSQEAERPSDAGDSPDQPAEKVDQVFTTARGDFKREGDHKTLLTPHGKKYVHRRNIIELRDYASFVYLVDDWGVFRYEPSEDSAPDLPPSRYHKVFTEIYTTPRNCALAGFVINWGKQHYYVMYHHPKNVSDPEAPRKKVFRGLLRCYERTDNSVAIQYIPYFGLSDTENWLVSHVQGDRNMLTLTIEHEGADVPYLLRMTPADDFIPPAQ